MKIAEALLKLINETEFHFKTREEFEVFVKDSIEDMTEDPRGQTQGNGRFLHAAMHVIIQKVENLYGEGDDSDLHEDPFFFTQPWSQIVPWKDNNKKFVLTIGTCARTWEEVFYDLCHESLHLLNPVTDVKNKKISALEEGCAVSFAEAMYEKYISSYCNKVPTTSPTYDKSSQYFLAYFATKKIPDDVLKQVREVFGSFSTIDNVEKFTELVLPYASEEDIKILTTPFIYRK